MTRSVRGMASPSALARLAMEPWMQSISVGRPFCKSSHMEERAVSSIAIMFRAAIRNSQSGQRRTRAMRRG